MDDTYNIPFGGIDESCLKKSLNFFGYDSVQDFFKKTNQVLAVMPERVFLELRHVTNYFSK